MHVSEYATASANRGSADGSLNPVFIHPAELITVETRSPGSVCLLWPCGHNRSKWMANTCTKDASLGCRSLAGGDTLRRGVAPRCVGGGPHGPVAGASAAPALNGHAADRYKDQRPRAVNPGQLASMIQVRASIRW